MNDGNCYLCNGNNYRLIVKKSKYGIFKCNDCDFVFTTPISNQQEIDAYYSKFDYKDSLSAEKVIRSDAKRSLKQISKFLTKKGELLDVGCGRGYFLDEARKLGWKIYGVDASEIATDYARTKLHLNVFRSNIFTFQPTQAFDIITLNQVIEHFVNPDMLINKCAEHLKKGGLLYIATPNVESISAKVLKDNFDHYIPPEHVSYFSQLTLRKLLEKLGFRVLHIGSWSYPADLGGIIKAFLGKRVQVEHLDRSINNTQVCPSYRLSYSNIKEFKSFLFDRIFCQLFYKVLAFDSWGIILEVLAVKL